VELDERIAKLNWKKKKTIVKFKGFFSIPLLLLVKQ
jgi:hypothetical protein